MRFLAISLSCVLASLGFVQTAAAQDFWSYKDWNVSIEKVESEQDGHKRCVIFTGGDGLPSISATFFSGDAGPPYSYPEVSVLERAFRGHATLMKNGEPVYFSFDDGDSVTGKVEAGFDEEGFAFANGRVAQKDNILALQAMRRNGELAVSVAGGSLIIASLNGFSAAYLKMAEVCEFSTEGVLD
ncbi:hypothetical protein [Labrenzia sp. CE80]|uniref:hypothetical protein n=1 Tax=Labrenzia sp. CE80 TaxID=1788986 RepID=UPI00129B8940|nr:hypothetical protein [Labrenzia sp. CE80]